jgi:hypothetical protein
VNRNAWLSETIPAAKQPKDEARQVAVEKAEVGEEITVATPREIVAEAKKKRRPRRQKAVPADQLGCALSRCCDACPAPAGVC